MTTTMSSKPITILIVILAAAALLDAGIVRQRRSESNEIPPTEQETKARVVLERCERRYQEGKAKETHAAWAYTSNLTEYNLIKNTEAATEFAAIQKSVAEELRQFDYRTFRNEDLKRRFKRLAVLGYAALPEDKFKELFGAVSSMESNYAKIKICSYRDSTNCHMTLDPEITELLGNSRDPEELKYYWIEWYNKAGKPTRESFQKYVDLNKESAKLNGFNNGAEVWLDEYDDQGR